MFSNVRHGEGYGCSIPSGIIGEENLKVQDTDLAVHRLDPESRAICVQIYVIGGPVQEVSRRVGIPKRTLYHRIQRIHQEILGHLNDVCAGC